MIASVAMRAAIYARYSSDLQDGASIEDQLRVCRDFIAQRRGAVAGTYADHAISGAHLKSRPEAQRMLADARAGAFDTIVCEALDRLSRDQEDVAGIYKRLRFAGVAILTIAEGEISELHVGLKGTMNALFLKDLAAKIRRGQSGRALKGLCAGGLAYGYDVVRQLDGHGEPVRGLRRINETQAAVVRRIFDAYVGGQSPRAIATALNREGTPSPSGGRWNASTISGNAGRGTGILANQTYRGMLVWNRLTMVKDPETGRRLSRRNDERERIVTAAAHLRIVSDAVWEATQRIKGRYATLGFCGQARRPKRLFSGLLRCGCCGGAYTIKNGLQLACATHRETGTCENGRTITAPELERRVLTGIRDELLAPRRVAIFVETYRAERDRLARDTAGEVPRVEKRLATLDRQIGNLVDAIAEGIASPEMKTRLATLEQERAGARFELQARLADRNGVVALRPQAPELWRNIVASLIEGQGTAEIDQDGRLETARQIRALVRQIEIWPGPERGRTRVEFDGLIEALLTPPDALYVVAEEGFTRQRATVKIAC